MKRYILAIAFLCSMLIPGVGHAVCDNRPSGLGLLTSFPFTARDGNGWTSQFAGGGNLISDSGDPKSPPSALEYTWTPGTVSPNNGGNYNIARYNLSQTRIYVCFQWRPSATWTGWHTNQNKLQLTDSVGHVGHNYLLMTDADGVHNGGPYVINMQTGHGGASNAHICGGSICNLFPNVPGANAVVNLGSQNQIEYELVVSSCPTCRNGVIRIWVRGQLTHNFTTINTGSLFGTVEFNPVWDFPRPNCPACPGNSLPDRHAWGDVEIWAGSGGGGTPPDTTPPSTVTNLQVT